MSTSDYQTQDELLGVPSDFIKKNSLQHSNGDMTKEEFLDGDIPYEFFGGKSRNQVIKEMEEYGKKMKEANEIMFSCRLDEYLVQSVEVMGYWEDFARTRNQGEALMIQKMLNDMGKTTRITGFRTISKMFEVVEGSKNPKTFDERISSNKS